jgi:ketosteroid isomerase-like protein
VSNSEEADVLAAERQFFDALIESNGDGLDALLSDDFILVDVMTGSEMARSGLIDVVKSGLLKFDSIAPAEVRVRVHGSTAIVNGRTEMSGHYGPASFTARSRYTHVYLHDGSRWRLTSAQGTPIRSA